MARDLVQMYFDDLRKHPSFEGDEATEYIRAMRSEQDEKIRRKMFDDVILRNMRTVRVVAYKNASWGRRHSLAVIDLISVGVIGLIRAIEKFDVDRGVPFSRYAELWVRKSIQHSIQRMPTPSDIRLPAEVLNARIRVYKLRIALSVQFGQEPTEEELFTALRHQDEEEGRRPTSKATFESVLMYSDNTARSFEGSDRSDARGLHDIIPSQDHSPETKVIALSLVRDIYEHLQTRSVRDREIVAFRIGLYGEVMSLERIGVMFGLTREAIRQIQIKELKLIEKRFGLGLEELQEVVEEARRFHRHLRS